MRPDSESVILAAVGVKLALKILKHCTLVLKIQHFIILSPPFKVSDTWAGPQWVEWVSSTSKESLGGGNGLMEMYQVLCPRCFKTNYIQTLYFKSICGN